MTLVTPDVEQLLTMSQRQLDDLFRSSPAGEIPRGVGEGTVIAAPGTPVASPVARLAHWLAWQGKAVDAAKGELRNLISPLGVRAIKAKVYVGTSLFDGEKAIVLDYSKTSLIARFVRDEIRLVGPALYLGVVYWDGAKILNFSLQFAHPAFLTEDAHAASGSAHRPGGRQAGPVRRARRVADRGRP